jgi:hypothetical protein
VREPCPIRPILSTGTLFCPIRAPQTGSDASFFLAAKWLENHAKHDVTDGSVGRIFLFLSRFFRKKAYFVAFDTPFIAGYGAHNLSRMVLLAAFFCAPPGTLSAAKADHTPGGGAAAPVLEVIRRGAQVAHTVPVLQSLNLCDQQLSYVDQCAIAH